MKAVKRRAYDSSLRKEQAEQTRTRISEAAWKLFEAHGYAATTIKQIAQEARVAPDTVYAIFGSKPRVLTALIDERLSSGTGLSNVMQRPEFLAVRDERDQRKQLELFAADFARIVDRVRPAFEMMRTASSTDGAMRKIYREMEGYRLKNLTQVASWLAANGPLRVPVEKAAAIIWTIGSPDVAKLLRDVQNWSIDEYSTFLADTLTRVLLLPEGAGVTAVE